MLTKTDTVRANEVAKVVYDRESSRYIVYVTGCAPRSTKSVNKAIALFDMSEGLRH